VRRPPVREPASHATGGRFATDCDVPPFGSIGLGNAGGYDALTVSAATISGGRSADCPDASDPGVDSCGGGVLSHGTLTVNQSRVINNTATSSANGGIFVEGGGIENIAGATTVSRSEVSGNTASYTGSEPFSAAFGGGIGNETSLAGDQGSLTVDQSRLVDNTVSATGSSGEIGDGGFAEGGAIDNFAPAKVDRSVISNNHSIAPDSGSARAAGVLNAIGASMAVSRTAITDNTASAPNGEAIGGGIQSDSRTATLTLTDSIVSGNTLNVTGAGSAIGAGIDNSLGTVTISNALITDNAARTTGGSAAGGGLRNRGTTSLTHVVVSDNTTTGSTALGGGLRNSGGAGPLTLTRSAVTHNTASGTTAAGGGISDATSPSTVTITMTAVFGNRPDNCSPPNGTCN
jgi:hypothetical protein